MPKNRDQAVPDICAAPGSRRPHSFSEGATADTGQHLESTVGAVQHLLARRAALDEGIGQQDTLATALLLRRAQPTVRALVLMERSETVDWIAGLLVGSSFEVDRLRSVPDALDLLGTGKCLVVVTDSIELIRGSREIAGGAGSYTIFVTSDEAAGAGALRAGANDCLSRQEPPEYAEACLARARRTADLEASLQMAVSRNRTLSTIDELTQAGNRRFFERQFPREVQRAARAGKALSVIMCDIDYFKTINDRYGHPAGDEVLREFGRRLLKSVRRQDWVARLGGEEFALVLGDTPLREAVDIAGRLREKVRGEAYPGAAQDIRLTASFGVCGLDRVPAHATGLAERLVKAADQALYNSKHGGRDRITHVRFTAPSAAR